MQGDECIFFFRWPVLNSLQCSTLPAPDNLASSDGFSPGIQCVKIFHHSITGYSIKPPNIYENTDV